MCRYTHQSHSKVLGLRWQSATIQTRLGSTAQSLRVENIEVRNFQNEVIAFPLDMVYRPPLIDHFREIWGLDSES